MPVLLALSFIVLGNARAQLPFAVGQTDYRTIPRVYVLDGVVEAVDRSTVSAQTSGRVEEVLVDVNDQVAAGAAIIRLRDADQRARLNQADANLKEAQARFNEARSEHQRISKVYGRKLVSKADMDAASAALEAARARLEAARAGVAQAQEELENTVIKAPYGGIVLERHVELGEAVRPGMPLMSGFSLERLRVVANVPQRLIEPVREHARARVLMPDGAGSVMAEKLVFFPYADPESNVFKVRVYLPPNTEKLYPGMFVKIAFSIGEQSRLTVPGQAVARRSEVSGVYVIDGDRITFRQIRVGRALENDRVEVLAGLDAGEKVALEPIAAGIYLKAHPGGLSP